MAYDGSSQSSEAKETLKLSCSRRLIEAVSEVRSGFDEYSKLIWKSRFLASFCLYRWCLQQMHRPAEVFGAVLGDDLQPAT